jgi:hypothetical protein
MRQKLSVLGAAVAAVVLGTARCGGPSDEGGQGAECFRAEECGAGLVCIDHKCTNDLTSVNFRAEAGAVDGGALPLD